MVSDGITIRGGPKQRLQPGLPSKFRREEGSQRTKELQRLCNRLNRDGRPLGMRLFSEPSHGRRFGACPHFDYPLLYGPLYNLQGWGLVDDKKCAFCHEDQTLRHVLFGCSYALAHGRYTWRHNQVFEVIAEAVKIACSKANAVSRM